MHPSPVACTIFVDWPECPSRNRFLDSPAAPIGIDSEYARTTVCPAAPADGEQIRGVRHCYSRGKRSTISSRPMPIRLSVWFELSKPFKLFFPAHPHPWWVLPICQIVLNACPALGIDGQEYGRGPLAADGSVLSPAPRPLVLASPDQLSSCLAGARSAGSGTSRKLSSFPGIAFDFRACGCPARSACLTFLGTPQRCHSHPVLFVHSNPLALLCCRLGSRL